MAIKIDSELEKAILNMPTSEKDKLLLRLLRQKEMLVRQLEHKLLGDQQDTADRRRELLDSIRAQPIYGGGTPGLIMMDMRAWSGDIGRHVKITKDKFGETQLLLALLNHYFAGYEAMLRRQPRRADTFAEFVCAKCARILQGVAKMHPDEAFELTADLQQLRQYVEGYEPTAQRATAVALAWPGAAARKIAVPKTVAPKIAEPQTTRRKKKPTT